MKRIIFIIVILFNSAIALAIPHNIYAKISINHDPATKVTLTHGYKALFCQIEDITIQTPGPLGIKGGNSVAGISTINNALYKNLMQNAPCISDAPIKEIIVGDTLIDYAKGYQGDETFFIIDNKMYRTGGSFYNYYVDENYQTDATLGGKMKRTYDENAIEGIEYTGSEYFFEAEYLSLSSDSARLENTKYIKHYSETGIDDGTIITFRGKSYRRTEIIKELSNEILLEYEVPDLSPTPDPTANWKIYQGEGFKFKYPSEKFTVEKSGFSYQIIPLFISRNSVFDIINIKSLIITPEELNLLYENKVRSLENPISTPLKNGNKIVGNGNRQTHFYDGRIMYAYLNSSNTFLEISNFNEETFNYLDEILETLEFTERSQENYNEALDYEVEVLKSELWAASSRYYNTFSSFPWEKEESCKNAFELQSSQEIETGILKPCIDVLVQQGELKTYHLDLSNILLSSVLVTRLDNEIMACSMPRSITGQSDPDTSYDKSGTKKSTCKSSGGGDTCYKCTNISY